MSKQRQWVCFFSQTGTEINCIRKALGRDPDYIIFNNSSYEKVNKELLQDCRSKIIEISNRPSKEEYERICNLLEPDCLITLHGYLRILPGWFCDKYYILNGHPGNTLYDNGILRGSNPQEKAYRLGLKCTASTIHRCTAELDAGEVIDLQSVYIEGLTLDEVYERVHDNSVSQWIRVLGRLFNAENV